MFSIEFEHQRMGILLEGILWSFDRDREMHASPVAAFLPYYFVIEGFI